jgi:hypothetical protein
MAWLGSTKVSLLARVERSLLFWDVHISRADQEKLETILADLDKPINRMATQLSDLHDSLEREFPPVPQPKNPFLIRSRV